MRAKLSYRQSIITKYHGPTSKKGSGISAKTSSDIYKTIISEDHSFSAPQLHEKAANALLAVILENDRNYAFEGKWIGGPINDNADTYVWVRIPKDIND